jgi:hypothetical protein
MYFVDFVKPRAVIYAGKIKKHPRPMNFYGYGFLPLQPALHTGQGTSTLLNFRGKSTLPTDFYTYKPDGGCHRRSLRRDGTPSLAAFSPLVATSLPLFPLLQRTNRFPALSSSGPSSPDPHPPSIESIRRVSGPPRLAPGSQLTYQQNTHTQRQHYQLASPIVLPLRQAMPLNQGYQLPNFWVHRQPC